MRITFQNFLYLCSRFIQRLSLIRWQKKVITSFTMWCRCLSILVLYDLEQKLSMPFPDEWRKAISDYDGVINIEAK